MIHNSRPFGSTSNPPFSPTVLIEPHITPSVGLFIDCFCRWVRLSCVVGKTMPISVTFWGVFVTKATYVQLTLLVFSERSSPFTFQLSKICSKLVPFVYLLYICCGCFHSSLSFTNGRFWRLWSFKFHCTFLETYVLYARHLHTIAVRFHCSGYERSNPCTFLPFYTLYLLSQFKICTFTFQSGFALPVQFKI